MADENTPDDENGAPGMGGDEAQDAPASQDHALDLEDMGDTGPSRHLDEDEEIDPRPLFMSGDSEDTEIPEMPRSSADLESLYDVPIQISAVLGRSTMQVDQLVKLGRGAVVEMDRKVGEAIDIYVNNRLVARGEVVVVEDKLGVTMTEIIKTDRA